MQKEVEGRRGYAEKKSEDKILKYYTKARCIKRRKKIEPKGLILLANSLFSSEDCQWSIKPP